MYRLKEKVNDMKTLQKIIMSKSQANREYNKIRLR